MGLGLGLGWLGLGLGLGLEFIGLGLGFGLRFGVRLVWAVLSSLFADPFKKPDCWPVNLSLQIDLLNSPAKTMAFSCQIRVLWIFFCKAFF